jgi:hypothetical protein
LKVRRAFDGEVRGRRVWGGYALFVAFLCLSSERRATVRWKGKARREGHFNLFPMQLEVARALELCNTKADGTSMRAI